MSVLPGLVRPDRALRVAAENSLNHFDLAVPDLEHVHIRQPTVEVHETGCNSCFISATGKRRCVCVMLKPLAEQLCVVVVVETPPSQRSHGVANGASTSGFGENPEKYLFAASFMYSRVLRWAGGRIPSQS